MKQICILSLAFIISSCTPSKNEGNINILFPEFNITMESLIEGGFKNLPEDVVLFGKQFADTLLYYQFSEDSDPNSKPTYQLCSFPIKSFDVDTLEYFFQERNYFIRTKPEVYESIISFYVSNSQNNFFFRCEVDKQDSTMFISFGYPKIPCQ